MKNPRITFIAISLLALTIAFNFPKADLTGTWDLDVQTDMGSGNPTFVLKQTADGKITGTYTGQLGDSELTGMIKADDTFHIEFDIQGNKIEYDGKAEGGKISGKVKLGSMASGTFTGVKK
ncbi:hypothetical protein [Algoriphagus marinus]|uniref:hypothetical protein n=1 Tax=Algoriphagus marinus TaxID=1925762 RepID=UPI00094BA0F5|nr:hypothetical protein [Algoriphagus marinus]